MPQSTVKGVLVVYFLVLWEDVIIRSDRFPLTWAPLYTAYQPHDTISIRITD